MDIEPILVIIVTVKSQVLYLLLASATFCELNQCKFLLTKTEIKPKVLGKVLLYSNHFITKNASHKQ